MKQLPRILCIGGHDPTGGAGIQADIETVTALGGKALALITALTEQDTRDIKAVTPTPANVLARQADTLLADIRVDAIKIGLIGGAAQVAVLADLLRDFTGPVVLDPVLAAGGGFDLDTGGLCTEMQNNLLPLATLMTPNRAEARRLADRDDPMDAAQLLLDAGARAVLLTGADEAQGDRVENLLVTPGRAARAFSWPRLSGRFHGSGCTLASACATRLALGDPLASAVQAAQEFTHEALTAALRVGHGQWLPDRRTAR